MLARRDERILEPLPEAGALGMGCVGRGSANPDHLESRTRTLGRSWRRREESAMLGEGSELWREGGEREEEEGRKKRGTRNPLYRWKPHLPKPLQLAGAPPPLRELSSHRHTALGGTLFHGATKKLVLPNPPALREEIELRLLLWR